MELIRRLETSNLGNGAVSKASPDLLLQGDPTFTTWVQDESRNGLILSGVWEATPGTTKSIKGERFEFCMLLQGVVELTEQNGKTVTYRAGDAFVMKPGYVGVWRTVETCRKLFVVVD